MAKQSSAAVAKPATKTIVVDEAEFVRTRDAVITSWTRLHGALQSAIQAYIDHSNAVLGGEKALNQSGLNLLMNAAVAPVTAADPVVPTTEATPREIKFEGDDGEKRKRTRAKAPKDPNAPKRPLTAYLLYLEEMRPIIQNDLGPGQRRGDISSEGTRRWHELSDAAKQVYKDRYTKSWEEYLKALEAYKIAHPESPLNQIKGAVEPDPADPEDDEAEPPKPKKAPAKPRAKKAAEAKPAPAPEPVAPADASTDSDAESSVVSSDDSDSDSEAEAPTLPTPPKPTATTPAKKATPRTTAAAKAKATKAAAVDASDATLASSPPRTNKKPKESFTAVNGKTDTPNKKRKSAATEEKEEKKEAPKAKRAKKVKEPEVEVEAEAEAAAEKVEEVKEKKKPGRKRKSAVGGE